MGKRKAPTGLELAQINAVVTSVGGVTSILAALRDLNPYPRVSLEWQRRLAEKELYEIAGSTTPYGDVCVFLQPSMGRQVRFRFIM